MFEFLLSIRVSFLVVRVGRMHRRCAETLPFFWEKASYAEFSFLSSWRRRSGGRARGDRHISWLIGVEGVARRNMPVNPPGLISSVEGGIVSCGKRCDPAFNGTDIHWRHWNWRRDGWLRWLGAVCIIHSNYGHRCQHIVGVGWQIEVLKTGRHNRLLTAKPLWYCGVVKVRVQRHNSWFRRGDRGDCDDLSLHSSGYLRRVEDRRGNNSDKATFFRRLLHLKDIGLCGRRVQGWVHSEILFRVKKTWDKIWAAVLDEVTWKRDHINKSRSACIAKREILWNSRGITLTAEVEYLAV